MVDQISSPQDILLQTLTNLQSAQKTAASFISDIQSSVSDSSLKEALTDFRDKLDKHTSKISQTQEKLGSNLSQGDSMAMEGLQKEVSSLAQKRTGSTDIDLAILNELQKATTNLIIDYTLVASLVSNTEVKSEIHKLIQSPFNDTYEFHQKVSSMFDEKVKHTQLQQAQQAQQGQKYGQSMLEQQLKSIKQQVKKEGEHLEHLEKEVYKAESSVGVQQQGQKQGESKKEQKSESKGIKGKVEDLLEKLKQEI